MWPGERRLKAQWVVLGIAGVAMGCRSNGGSVSAPQTDRASLNSTPASARDSGDTEGVAPKLSKVGFVLPAGDPGKVDVLFEVYADRDTRPISPLIYGVNFELRDLPRQNWGVIRSGGNRLTAYNWENNASNAGSDYFFQNDSAMFPTTEPAQPLLNIIDAAASIGSPTIITIPNLDYVSADTNGGGDVRNSGEKYLSTRFKRNYAKKPTPFAAAPDVGDDAVYQDEFVAFLKAQRPQAKLIFSMDNEPELWSHTHAEIYPKPVTYAELWKRNQEFAKATKDVWPSAEVLGFVSFGYSGFTSLQNASDSYGRNFIAWYLDQAKAAEKSSGKRLIDYLDLHWYPEAQGGGQRIVGEGVEPEVVAAREQAPRSLWDPKYEEKSWIRDSAGGPIDLLHWVQAKIDVHYPGTKLACTEWNFGGGNHISGAIATADVLGVFGRFGVNLASYWPLAKDEPFAFAAFRAFRNFDGQRGAFGDTSIAANSSDVELATVYASISRADPARTVVIAINKSTDVKTAGLKIGHSVVYRSARVFVITSATADVIGAPSISSVATNTFRYPMPPQSISVIVPMR